MTKPLIVQRRLMELGRVRMGDKGPKGEPRKLATFRFTSASRLLLESVAALYGGKVQTWENAPNDGMFEVTTETNTLNIVLPPTYSESDGTPTTTYSQWYELWSASGCKRRCDGVTEAISGGACLCDSEARECQIITRVSFMLPDLPGLGVWRLDSHGWNAAAELTGTLDVLIAAANEHVFIPAVLRMENRTDKKDGQTRRYVVPVIDLPTVTVGQLLSGDVGAVALNAPRPVPERPQIPSGPAPVNAEFEREPEMGSAPQLPVAPAVDSSAATAVGALTLAEFKTRAAEALIAPPLWDAKVKELYPNANLANLVAEERGAVFDALLEDKRNG